MKAVFLDTVGLVALWERADQWRAPALRAMASINTPGTRLLTTPQVLLECANAAARKPYRSEVCLLRRGLLSQGNLIIPSHAELEQASTAYERDIAGGASIVDHISFLILRRLAITDVFTNDRHFKTAGFNTPF